MRFFPTPSFPSSWRPGLGAAGLALLPALALAQAQAPDAAAACCPVQPA